MVGVAGRSGGHNRRSVTEHEVRGTLRPSRHLTHHLPQLASQQPDGWKPTPADLTSLGKEGRRFVRDWLGTYTVSRAESVVLMQAAVAHDRLAALRAHDRSTLSAREDGMLQRLELNWSKLLAGLLAQLRIQR